MITKETVEALLEAEEKLKGSSVIKTDDMKVLCQSWLEQREEIDFVRSRFGRGTANVKNYIESIESQLTQSKNQLGDILHDHIKEMNALKEQLSQTQEALEKAESQIQKLEIVVSAARNMMGHESQTQSQMFFKIQLKDSLEVLDQDCEKSAEHKIKRPGAKPGL